MNTLDTEMEREIEELRKRYETKRQPILDAIDMKRKRQQQNFWGDENRRTDRVINYFVTFKYLIFVFFFSFFDLTEGRNFRKQKLTLIIYRFRGSKLCDGPVNF